MMKPRTALWLLAAGLLFIPLRSPGPIVITPGEGAVFVPPGGEAAPERGSAGAQYDQALADERAGAKDRALSGYRTVVRRYPRSPQASNAQYRIAYLLEKMGDLENAYRAYLKLNKDYPRSEDFSASLEGQMRVANAYLEGRRAKVLGIPTLPSMSRAVDMYTAIIKNAPYSRYAPAAQFNLGRAKEKQGDNANAIAAYQVVIDKYPTSDVADDAMFQIGYVYMSIMRTGSYDRNAAKFSREYFEDFLVAYPRHEKAAQAREYLKSLTSVQVRSSLKTAEYYDKQKVWKAAVMHYNEVVRTMPGTKDASVAEKRLAQLRVKLGEEFFKNPILTPGKPDPKRMAELQQRGMGQGLFPGTGGGAPVSRLPPNAPGLDAPLPGVDIGPSPEPGPGPGTGGLPGSGFDTSNPFDTPAPLNPAAPTPSAAPPEAAPPEATPAPTP